MTKEDRMSKPKPPAAQRTSTKQIAKDAVRGGPKSMKKAKRPGAQRGQKG
jgi:hypothetical protein